MKRFSELKTLARTVVPVTCLAAVAVINATAATIAEPGDGFGSTFGTATLLPVGTDTVTGGLCNQCSPANNNDWFEIQGLLSGSTVTITEAVTSEGQVTFLVFDSSQSALQSNYGVTQVGGSVVSPFTVPGDGLLFFDIQNPNLNTTPTAYEVSISVDSSSAAPEPGTWGAGAFGLLAALRMRRRFFRK